MKIDPKKLELLHKYLQNDGDASTEGFKTFLATNSDNVVKAYQDALVEEYPDVYGDDEEEDLSDCGFDPLDTPEEEEATEACSIPCCGKRILLYDEATGTATELEVKSETDKSLVFEAKTPKDEIDIRVAGEDLTVDLIKLKKMQQDSLIGGHKVSTLILAAELAKA